MEKKLENGMEQFFKTTTEATEKTWDFWLTSVGMLTWGQEQTEKMVKTFIEQGKVNREEGKQILEELGAQVRKNQAELQKIVEEGVKSALANMQLPDMSNFFDLTKRMEELTKRMERGAK